MAVSVIGALILVCARPLARYSEVSGAVLVGSEPGPSSDDPHPALLWSMRLCGLAVMACGLLLP